MAKSLAENCSSAHFLQVNAKFNDAGNAKEGAIDELSATISTLRLQVDRLDEMLCTALWFTEQELTLRDLKRVLESSFAKQEAR